MGTEKHKTIRYADPRPHRYPGKASDFIQPFNRQPGQRVVLCCRVSGRVQNHNGNLRDQERGLREIVKCSRGKVVEVVHDIGPGWDLTWLCDAAARAQKHGAILLAETTDRFIRPREYHSAKRPDARPSKVDFKALRNTVAGVRLMTALHPDAPAAEARCYHTKRGQQAKGREGGRPPKKLAGHMRARREQLLPLVLELRGRGLGYGRIGWWVDLPRSTVQGWVKRSGR